MSKMPAQPMFKFEPGDRLDLETVSPYVEGHWWLSGWSWWCDRDKPCIQATSYSVFYLSTQNWIIICLFPFNLLLHLVLAFHHGSAHYIFLQVHDSELGSHFAIFMPRRLHVLSPSRACLLCRSCLLFKLWHTHMSPGAHDLRFNPLRPVLLAAPLRFSNLYLKFSYCYLFIHFQVLQSFSLF